MKGRNRLPREYRIALLLAVPFAALAAFSMMEIRQVGDYWHFSRDYIRIYCVGIVAAGLAITSISTARIMGDHPDSVRLRGWANFLVGLGYANTGVLLQWYLLSRRNYEHPSLQPFKSLVLLLVAWIVLVLSSIYAVWLERRAARRDSVRQKEVRP